MCDLEQADALCLHADSHPEADPWQRPGMLISPGGAQAAHPLWSLWAMAGVGVVLHSSKMAIEQWPVCSQGLFITWSLWPWHSWGSGSWEIRQPERLQHGRDFSIRLWLTFSPRTGSLASPWAWGRTRTAFSWFSRVWMRRFESTALHRTERPCVGLCRGRRSGFYLDGSLSFACSRKER